MEVLSGGQGARPKATCIIKMRRAPQYNENAKYSIENINFLHTEALCPLVSKTALNANISFILPGPKSIKGNVKTNFLTSK